MPPVGAEAIDRRECEGDADKEKRPAAESQRLVKRGLQTDIADEDRQHDNGRQRNENEDDAEKGEGKRDRVEAEESAAFFLVVNDIERRTSPSCRSSHSIAKWQD